MTLEACDLPAGGTEQTLVLDAIKLSVAEEPPPSSTQALPETLVTVSKRRRTFSGDPHGVLASSDHLFEVIFTSRAVRRERATSVEQLADTFDHARHSRVEQGDLETVANLLESAARTYGTTPDRLIEAVCRVAPREIGAVLTELYC